MDHKESWAPKNWSFWTVVLEKTLMSPLDCMEIQPINPKENQFWIFIGRTEAEVEAPILWPPDAKNWFIWKDPDAGKDWRWEKGVREDEIIGRHHQLSGHEFEQALGDSEGQGSLASFSPWIHKELDTTERLRHTHTYSSTTEAFHDYSPGWHLIAASLETLSLNYWAQLPHFCS